MSKEKEYVCTCGKICYTPSSFGGHKQQCEVFIKEKYGSLEAYYTIKNRSSAKGGETLRKQHADRKAIQLANWIAEKHICEKCGILMTSKFSTGRFCSRACANSRVHTEETKQRISDKLTVNKAPKIFNCLKCGKPLNPRNRSGLCRFCFQHQPPSEETRRKQSETMKSKNYPRWNIHRNIPSYAEKFFMSVLENNNISYEFEKPVVNNKNHFYYLDFYIEKAALKIDLEIDGKQHKDRTEHDIVRDAFLTEQGYIVYRISWNNINTASGKQIMQQKINDFIAFYNSL